MVTKTTIALILLIIGGCGTIDNATRSDESIQKKTAFALGTTPDKITISERTGDLMSVNFMARYDGRTYQCYYSSSVGISSDVLCSPTDGKPMPKSQHCNALLSAAGKC